MIRHFWILAGLYMAFFLTVAGLTGSILAFDGEIRDWLNPPSRVGVRAQPMLDPVALRERALALAPQGQITWVSFHREPGEAHRVSFEPRTDPTTGKPYALGQINRPRLSCDHCQTVSPLTQILRKSRLFRELAARGANAENT